MWPVIIIKRLYSWGGGEVATAAGSVGVMGAYRKEYLEMLDTIMHPIQYIESVLLEFMIKIVVTIIILSIIMKILCILVEGNIFTIFY